MIKHIIQRSTHDDPRWPRRSRDLRSFKTGRESMQRQVLSKTQDIHTDSGVKMSNVWVEQGATHMTKYFAWLQLKIICLLIIRNTSKVFQSKYWYCINSQLDHFHIVQCWNIVRINSCVRSVQISCSQELKRIQLTVHFACLSPGLPHRLTPFTSPHLNQISVP